MDALTNIGNGMHFSAINAHADQIKGFHISAMAEKMIQLAPHLWHLLGRLMTRGFVGDCEPEPMNVDEDQDMANNLEEEVGVLPEGISKEEQKLKERAAVLLIVSGVE